MNFLKQQSIFYAIISSAILIFSACNNKTDIQKFTVKGNIANAEGKMIYLSNIGIKSIIPLDSTKIGDGTVFDSSIKRGEPAVFGVNQVIKGWVEALQLMQEGAKWRLYIPYDMAYGEHGAGEMIPPYSALIFDVELIKVL